MDFLKIFSMKEVKISQFQVFYTSNASKVEKIINSILKNDSFCNSDLFFVLDKLSWHEWMKNRTSLVKPLSVILIVLLYDKITYITRLLDRLSELDEFLSQDRTGEYTSSHTNEGKNEYIRNINDLSEKAYRIDPLAPILGKNTFPLNKLLNLLLREEEICLEVLKLMNEIKNQGIYSNLLLLPYIFEICIPTKQKQVQGQVFTPLDVSEFICSQNLSEKTSRVIDPACGTGIFLLSALEILSVNSQNKSKIELIGIEKDPVLSAIALSALSYYRRFHSSFEWDFKIIQKDFFLINQNDLKSHLSSYGITTVLMNPPYTRQEKLTSNYKEFLYDKISNDYKDFSETRNSVKNIISGRSGLYTYFIIHATSLLRTGDNFGLIIPNSWLDVNYGVQVQHFLLDHYSIESIIVTRKEKLIANVDVNTAILKLIKRDNNLTSEMSCNENIVKFISIDRKTDLKSLNNIPQELKEHSAENINTIKVDQKNLYFSSKWGVYHRAPLSYFELITKIEKEVVELGDVAIVRRGFTTGANVFFYVGKPGYENYFFKSSWDKTTGDLLLWLKDKRTILQFKSQGVKIKEPLFVIEKEYWMHKINNTNIMFDWEFCFKEGKDVIWVPNYIIKSPKDVDCYEVSEKHSKLVVILISHLSREDDLKPGIVEYIKWGETWNPLKGKKFFMRPTCRSRKTWYKLPYEELSNFPLLCLMTLNERFPFFYNPRNFLFDARLYGIKFSKNEMRFFRSYFIYLNSIITSMQIELLGRSNLGEGALDIKVYEYERIKIPKSSLIVKNANKNVNHLYSSLCQQRPISVIDETPEKATQITEEYISNLFDFLPQFISSLSSDFKHLVESRLEKAGYLTIK